MATFKELFGKDLDIEAAENAGGEFEPIPKGRYTLCIEAVDDNRRSKSGKLAVGIKWRVVGPTHANRLVFQDLYVSGVSEKCADISFRMLAMISKCAFGKTVGSTGELVGAVVDADVEVSAQPGYKPKNEVRRYYVATKTEQTPAPAPAQTAQAAQPKQEEQMPWEF